MIADVATIPYAYVQEIDAPEASKLQWQYSIPADPDASTSQLSGFEAHFSKLKALATDHTLWAAPQQPPSDIALALARFVLQDLQSGDMQPNRVVASAEGGAAVCFINGNKYADIECLDSGTILGVISNKHDRPIVWEIEPYPRDIARAIERIREFIYSPETMPTGSRRTASR